MLDRERMHHSSPDECLEFFNAHRRNHLPSRMAMKSVSVTPTGFVVEMPVEPCMLNLNGSVHGGSIVALADTKTGSYPTHERGDIEAGELYRYCGMKPFLGESRLSEEREARPGVSAMNHEKNAKKNVEKNQSTA